MAVRLPGLLDSSLQEIARLHPTRLSSTDNLKPISTAEMVLPEGEESVPLRGFVSLYTDEGMLGIYRAASVRTIYGKQQQVSLEHGITTLEDCTAPEEADLSGNMHDILASILSWQNSSMWTLGDVEEPDKETLELSAGSMIALQALIDAGNLVEGYALFFDQTSFPWTVSYRKLPSEPSSECRLNRNISSASVSVDEADLCTRVTSSILPDGHLDGETIDTWGIISRPVDIAEDATEEEALQTAREYLSAHKDPSVSVEIDAIDLSALTGEPMDAFRKGDLCRMALPDYGTTVVERIVTVYRPDMLKEPSRIRLTLATPARSASRTIAGVRAKTESNASNISSTTKVIKENKDAIKQVGDTLVLEAEKVKILGEEIELRATKEEVEADRLIVNDVSIRLDAATASLALKADHAVVEEQGRLLNEAMILMDGMNAQILLKASQAVVDDLGQRVSSAEISIDGINSEIALKADTILLQGYVKADDFETLWLSVMEGAYIDSLNAGYIGCDSIGINGSLSAEDANLYTLTATTINGYAASWQSKSFVRSVVHPQATISTGVVNYKDHNGRNATMTVVTGITQYDPTAITESITFLGGTQ